MLLESKNADIKVRVYVLDVRVSNNLQGGTTPSSNLFCNESLDPLQPL